MVNAFFVAVVSKSAETTTMDGEYNIGRRIKEYVEENGIRIGWLSQRLHCHRNTIYNIFERNWIDTQMLMRLCIVLKHDFFAELSEQWQKKNGGKDN